MQLKTQEQHFKERKIQLKYTYTHKHTKKTI